MTIEKHLENLSDLVATENWSELTGPFFHIQIKEHEVIGPIKAFDLKKYQEDSPLPEETKIRDAKSLGGWQELYQHPLFQRRKPQILDSDEAPISQIHVLVDGQRHSPFDKEQVTQMLNQNELFLTDQVSFDHGETWKKIFQVEQFDRRNFSQTSLPAAPSWDVFSGSNTEIDRELQSENPENSENDAIAGLAFIENMTSGKTSKKRHKSFLLAQTEEAEVLAMPNKTIQDNQSSGFKFYYAMAIVLLLGTSSFFILNTPSSDEPVDVARTEVEPSVEAPELKPIPKKTRKRANYKAPRLNTKRSPRSRRPASIQESSSFQDRDRRQMRDRAAINDQKEENPYQDEYDYDQGDTPVEQDPVRKKLDKATIDPEENYYDYEEKEAFIDSQEELNAGELSPTEVWGDEGRLPAENRREEYFDDLEGERGFEDPEEVEYMDSDY